MAEKVFKIGDKVWVSRVRSTDEVIPCPVCFGDMKVTLILGDGTHVEVECDYCRKGWMGAQGVVRAGYVNVAEVFQKEITGVDNRRDGDEQRITYWFGSGGYSSKRVSDTREGALVKAEAEIAEVNKRADAKHKKHKDYKSYTWNAGHYMREAQRALEQHKRYLEKAKVMLSKARPKKDKEVE